ncbi:MAG: ABC transporter permease [Actinobacteria bacterium]|nr:ABC transporter permease [Actinomycetota bacterium]
MIRFEKRLHTPRWLTVGVPFMALVIALLFAAIVLLVTGHSPIETYAKMFEASVTNTGAFSASLTNATPLLFTGLCAAAAFRMRLWNIGGEGQLYAGAVAASGAGLLLGGSGAGVAVPVMIVAGMAAGAAWGAIPGILRAYLHTNEILTSLMLNYIAGLGMYYLIFDSSSYWRELESPSAKVFPEGKILSSTEWWPALHLGSVTVPLGLVIGIAFAAGLFVLYRATRFGFKIRVVADSPTAGRYAGLPTKRLVVAVMLISGALAGIGGASQIGDFTHSLDPVGLEGAAYGYTGIVVAALARLNPLGAIASALFLGALASAGLQLQGQLFPVGLVGIIEGIVLFCMVGSEILFRYRIRLRLSRRGRGAVVASEAAATAPATGTTSAAIVEGVQQ